MKNLWIAAALVFANNAAFAADAACEAQAAEKKLAGAAKTSFTKKCVTGATAAMKKPRRVSDPPSSVSAAPGHLKGG